MELDDDLCICFHVSTRKVLNFLRVERPQRAAQLSECFGAGTGCGWCQPFLRRLFEAAVEEGTVTPSLPTREQYAAMRARYLQSRSDEPSGEGGPHEEPDR